MTDTDDLTLARNVAEIAAQAAERLHAENLELKAKLDDHVELVTEDELLRRHGQELLDGLTRGSGKPAA